MGTYPNPPIVTGTPNDGDVVAFSAALGEWVPVPQGVNQAAVTAAVSAAVNALVNGAPGALDTLKELADAINDDASFAATVTAALAGKQPLDSDLTAIAALVTTSFGRSLLTQADAAAVRTAIDAQQTGTYDAEVFVSAKVMDATQGAPNYSVGVLGASGQRLGAFMMDDGTAGTNENVLGLARVPSSWTTFDVFVWWANGGAGSGDVMWQLQHLLIAPGTNLAAETADSNVTMTAAATSVDVETRLLAGLARGTAGLFRFEVQRVGNNAADTLVGDAGLIGVFLRRVS